MIASIVVMSFGGLKKVYFLNLRKSWICCLICANLDLTNQDLRKSGLMCANLDLANQDLRKSALIRANLYLTNHDLRKSDVFDLRKP